MSAHHYFRDFSYCDSGIIPWLLVWEYPINVQKLTIGLDIRAKRSFPSSGELNFTVLDAKTCMERVQNRFVTEATAIEEIDGLSMSFDTWRFNLRKSNTGAARSP